MKKVMLYFFAFVFICFLLPAMLTNTKRFNKKEKVEENIQNQEVSQEKEYNYKKYGTVKLLHSKTGEVEEVKLDDYIVNVVSAEMPVDFEQEALKAQSLVARTYTVYKTLNKKHENADICDDSTCCQAWISKDDRFAKWEESKREENWKD